MKIICTEKEKEWIKKLMLCYGRVDNCKLECDCRLKVPVNIYGTCWDCINENVEFEISKILEQDGEKGYERGGEE